MTTQEVQSTNRYVRQIVPLDMLFNELETHRDLNMIFSEAILNPINFTGKVIVEDGLEPEALKTLPGIDPVDYLSLVDGYRRVAGMIRWCAVHGVSPAGFMVPAVVTNDRELLRVIEGLDGASDSQRQDAVERVIVLATAQS